MRKRSRAGNGQSNGASSAIQLTDDERRGLSEANARLQEHKIQLADLVLHEHEIESQKQKIIARIGETNAALIEDVRKVSRAHGIDPDHPTAKWNLDLVGGTFSRIQ
jgi:hypothetical protein